MLQRHDMVRMMVKREVIANALSKVKISSDESKDLLDQYCQRFSLKSKDAVVNHINNKGITSTDLSWQIELDLRIRRYSLATFEAKAEQRFLKRKDTLDRVTYSLLRVENGYLARELYLQIAEGENDFKELAALHSSGPESTKGGQIGPVSLTQAHPKLAEKLRIHAPGSLIEPFQIQKWWLVVRLEQYQDACFNENIKQLMCTELFHEWAQDETTIILSAHQANSLTAPPA